VKPNDPSQKLQSGPDVDTIERLKSLTDFSESEWLDLLEIKYQDYFRFKSGFSELSPAGLRNLSSFYKIDEEALCLGKIDFEDVRRRLSPTTKREIPEYFLIGAHGRRRTTITSFEFLEEAYGWRLRNDALKYFKIPEKALLDPFAPISIRLITEVCGYLQKRRFSARDFFAMGAFSFQANRKSLLYQILSMCGNFEELYNLFFNETIFLYEQNCSYSYEHLTPSTGVITARSLPDVTRELGVKYLGNQQTCELKVGIWASLPGYINMSMAQTIHQTCEHRGDDACRTFVDFSSCKIHSDEKALSHPSN
jgi:hypothetical protein